MEFLLSPEGVVHEPPEFTSHLFILVFYIQAQIYPSPMCVWGLYLSSSAIKLLSQRSKESDINTEMLENYEVWSRSPAAGGCWPDWHQSILWIYFKTPLESHLKTKNKQKNPQKTKKPNPNKWNKQLKDSPNPQWKHWDLMIHHFMLILLFVIFHS